MEGKSKLTKEVVAQEARFILDNLLTAGQGAKEVVYDDLRRLCEQSVSLRLLDYINFLERFGYISYDRNTHKVAITADGERVVGGEKVAELVIDVVHHFRPVLSRARKEEGAAAGSPPPTPSGISSAPRRLDDKDLVDDRYEKLRTLGSGGIGTVYLARQVLLNRPVALKEIRELFGFFTEPQRMEIVKRFDEEVLKSAKMAHPNIAAIIDGNTGRDYPYVVSEYVGGGSLRRILRFAETIPPELSVKVFLQMLHALGHAHSKGVVHRGIKPENILFDTAGNVRLTDFGMARVVERDQAVIQHVYVGMGSVAYMAPELFVDPTSVGAQSDLYALGIIFYEMLARKLPGRRSPMPTKLHPTLPKIVDDLFDRLTQDERGDRYKSVDEVLEDFHKADASKAFLEPRGAMLFMDSPIAKLQLKPEAQQEEEQQAAAAATASTGAAPASRAEMTNADAGDDPPPLTPLPTGPLPPTTAPVPGLAALGASPSGEASLEDEDGVSEVEYDEDGTERPKRRRVQRPYSFQQRLKDRDK
jgi:eukaryotic-like serine/threonine-protein kinase